MAMEPRAGEIFLLKDEGTLLSLIEQPYAKEDILQELLAK